MIELLKEWWLVKTLHTPGFLNVAEQCGIRMAILGTPAPDSH
jgi:hypothetical protein